MFLLFPYYLCVILDICGVLINYKGVLVFFFFLQ